MVHIKPRPWLVAAWLLTLVAALAVLSASISAVYLTAIAIVGLAPLVVLLAYARHLDPTAADAIRAVVRERNAS